MTSPLACLDARRGNVVAARDMSRVAARGQQSDDIQQRAMFAICEASLLSPKGQPPRSWIQGHRAINKAIREAWGWRLESFRTSFPIVVDAAMNLGELGDAERLVTMRPRGPRVKLSPFLDTPLTFVPRRCSLTLGDQVIGGSRSSSPRGGGGAR